MEKQKRLNLENHICNALCSHLYVLNTAFVDPLFF